MHYQINCPKCQQLLRFAQDRVGQVISCPKCGEKLFAPAGAKETPAPGPPETEMQTLISELKRSNEFASEHRKELRGIADDVGCLVKLAICAMICWALGGCLVVVAVSK